MRGLAVNSFSPDIKIYMQLIKSSYREHARRAGAYRVLCMEEIALVT